MSIDIYDNFTTYTYQFQLQSLLAKTNVNQIMIHDLHLLIEKEDSVQSVLLIDPADNICTNLKSKCIKMYDIV